MHVLRAEFVTYATYASGLFCALNFMIWLIKITHNELIIQQDQSQK